MTHSGPRWALPGYALALTAAIGAPLLGPGYLLIRDAVSTPRSYLSDSAIGLGENAPRAVPQDFAVAALSAVVDGGVVVKSLLLAGLFLAAYGAGRLVAVLLPDVGVPGQLVAATVAVWNPYVAERLLQGHWSLLVGYGCLPWVAAAVLRARWAPAAFWIALAGLTPTGLVMAAIIGLVCAGIRLPNLARMAGIAVLGALPWALAAALGSALGTGETDGLALFAARAEPGLGTLGSLAGLGGIWNAEAVPGSRTTGFAVIGTVVLLAIVACGVPELLRRRTGERLVVLAVAAVLVPAALATAPGMAVLRAIVEAVPGLAILRDTQKWVALAMPGYALAGAAAVAVLSRWVRPGVVALAGCGLLLAVLPDLSWGVGGAVRPVHYPAGWASTARVINDAAGQPVAVLPVGSMRQFAWSGTAPVLDPLPRWLRADVLTTGDLPIGGTTIRGEGTHARHVQQLLEAGADPGVLADAGVGWVVVQRGTPGSLGSADQTLRALTPAYADADIATYPVGGVSPVASQSKRIAMIFAHLVWAGLLLGAATTIAAKSLRGQIIRSRAE